MKISVLETIKEKKSKGRKQFALLIDPDEANDKSLAAVLDVANRSGVDYLLVGGSLITNGYLESCIQLIKRNSEIPVVLFPGDLLQINAHADGILLLSLISGRNPELLIGKHVISAPVLKKSGLEILPTGYMLIDGGRTTSVSYMSNTQPIPGDKLNIAAATALAGQMLGLKLIYMDAGSGAEQHISAAMIKKVRSQVEIPIIVGGGIRNPEQAYEICRAGADMVVVGNAAEKDPRLVEEMVNAVKRAEEHLILDTP